MLSMILNINLHCEQALKKIKLAFPFLNVRQKRFLHSVLLFMTAINFLLMNTI